MRPVATGSETAVNTIGMVFVSRLSALTAGVPRASSASGRSATNSFAKVST